MVSLREPSAALTVIQTVHRSLVPYRIPAGRREASLGPQTRGRQKWFLDAIAAQNDAAAQRFEYRPNGSQLVLCASSAGPRRIDSLRNIRQIPMRSHFELTNF
jgi:hypothetical protein